MCGIAGYVGPSRIPDERISEALGTLAHRGPDHAAHLRFAVGDGREAVLLHTRLNIIDLNHRSDQPLSAGPLTVAFNGELYNYVELRDRLRDAGEPFETTSDTEVLVRLLGRDGLEALDRCEGMWAFASFDSRDGSVTLCRDRFGEKPLFVCEEPDGGIFFASEVKAIAQLRGGWPEVNLTHLRRYLVNGYKALHKVPDTFFRGVEQLGAGELLQIGADGSRRRRRYWNPDLDGAGELGYDEAVAGARERLIRAVEIRLRADVPLAFCMSGGVDSLSLISIAKRVFDYDVHGFTIINSDARYEEMDMVKHAVSELGVRHTPITLDTSGFLENLRGLVRQHDAPVGTISYYAHWLLMRSIAEHGYRISVSGTGADELFSGYYDHHLAYLKEVASDQELHARTLARWREHIEPIVRNPFLKDPHYFERDPGRRDHIFLDRERLAEMLHADFDEPFTETDYVEDLLRNRMLNELFHEAVPVILREDDLNAMSFSIENRSPFLDRGLFEFANRIPTRWLIREARAKVVIRDAMRGIVPEPVLDNRRKVGFNAPVKDLLASDDPSVRAALLDESPIFEHVRREAIEGLLDQASLPNSRSKFLFNFLCAKLFLEEFGS